MTLPDHGPQSPHVSHPGRRTLRPRADLSAAGRASLRHSLSAIARRIQAREAAVDGLGITVVVGTDLVFSGCNAFTRRIDDLQHSAMEGPCLLATESGDVVRSRSVGDGERRWPVFTPAAAALGLRSVVSTPLLADGAVIGSLILYDRASDGLDDLAPAALGRATEKVEKSLRPALLIAAADASAQVLAQALRARADIDLAVGILMDRYTMSVGQARTLLLQLSVQDEVDQVTAARSISHPDGDR